MMDHSGLPWIVRTYHPKTKEGVVALEHADIISIPDNEVVVKGIAPDNAAFIVRCVNGFEERTDAK